jgi:hypothetical protein
MDSGGGRWWIFDLPPRMDPLLILGIALGVAGITKAAMDHERYGTGALILTIVLSLPSGLLFVGTVLGTPREYLRGRRGSG